ncbi:cobalamin-dependent protein [Chloroflexota bacterium]
MRTLLINPPHPLSETPIIPMGLSYIAAVLEHGGYEVRVLDLLVSRYTRGKIQAVLAEYRPDIVGITSVTMNYPIASSTLKCCKEADAGIVTVMGGGRM